ncbi:hypothetical protein KP509_26G032500 [Ceratopteris richardii]|uniref:Uncharacterized protein n=1 Tax=Ceratopteris richardii TaxID=49495 RepID=A0A8T2RM63_CERRI|nr:hypothetical protein KP509_26G032500 [Ceratopteris richardii]
MRVHCPPSVAHECFQSCGLPPGSEVIFRLEFGSDYVFKRYPVFRPSDKAVLEKHCVQNIAQTKSIKEKRCRASARQEEISDRAQQKRHDLELQDDKTVFHLDYNSPRTHPPKNN